MERYSCQICFWHSYNEYSSDRVTRECDCWTNLRLLAKNGQAGCAAREILRYSITRVVGGDTGPVARNVVSDNTRPGNPNKTLQKGSVWYNTG
jgi:hypothetical protein